MAQGLDSTRRHFEAPFQLYADLRCPKLKDFHPISQAAHDAKELEQQRREGVLRLDECRTEGPRG